MVDVCLEFGVVMRRCDSKKSKGEAGCRLYLVSLACKHAMPNRQKEYSLGNTTGDALEMYSFSVRKAVRVHL